MDIRITDKAMGIAIKRLFKTTEDFYSALAKGYKRRDENLQILNIEVNPMKSSFGLYASIWLPLDKVEARTTIEQAEGKE